MTPHALRLWRRDTSVQSREDGLVTRSAFLFGSASLARRMSVRFVTLQADGLTATTPSREVELADYELHAQRYVAPLSLESRARSSPPDREEPGPPAGATGTGGVVLRLAAGGGERDGA